MNIAQLSVKRPITTIMVYIALTLLGLFAANRLAVDLMPELAFPSLNIGVSYSGAAPEEVEKLITIPLEQAVSAVNGVVGMSSSSQDGSSRVTLSFKWGTDLEAAANDVRANVERVRSRLPEGADAPRVGRFDPSQMPIMRVGISGDLDPAELRRLAEEEMVYYLERLDGVASVAVLGGRRREIRVELDPARLQAHGITIDQVVSAIRAENFNAPAGKVVVGSAQYSLRTFGELEDVTELRSILVANRNGVQTLLGDLADIQVPTDDLGAIVRVDGRPGVMLSIQKQSGSNTIQVADRVQATMEELRQRYPHLDIRALDDSTVFIRRAVKSVAGSAFGGGLLAGAILLFFLRSVWATLIVGLAIPVAIIASFILIERAGMTLNTMSLGGLALGVGMLVDNSIVVLENIHRHQVGGKSPLEAAMDGTGEMISAVTASTLTTLAVFVPLMFVSGMSGILFRQLSLMVAFSIGCSLFVSLTLVPVLSSRLPAAKEQGRLDRRIEGLLDGLDDYYARMVSRIMRHPVLVGLVAVTLFAGSLAILPFLGTELLSSADEGQISVRLSLPAGTRLETTDAMVQEVEALIRENVPELTSFQAQAGGGRSTSSGDVQLQLVPSTERQRSTEEIVADLRERLSLIPGLTSRVSARNSVAQRMMSGSFGGGSERITLNVQGQDRAVLRRVAEDLLARVAQVPGIANAGLSRSEGQPEFIVRVDRKRAADFGLTSSQVAGAVQSAMQGRVATQLRLDGRESDVRVIAAGAESLSPQEIESLPIPTKSGSFIPLGSVGALIQKESPEALERLNQQATIRLTASPDGRDLGSVVGDIRAAVSSYKLPDGVNVYFGGEYEEQQRAFRELLMVLFLAVALVYIVMAAQFESLGDPFIVMFSVPFGFVGVVLTLILTATPLTTQAYLGLIMLAGIVVNNAIVLISYIDLLRQQGIGLDEAILTAARSRLRPILMTTGTTVLGLIPLALELGEGAELQSPLARTVMGGLIASTLVTLVLIPTIYRAAHGRRAKARPLGATTALLLTAALTAALAFSLGTGKVAAADGGLTLDEALKEASAAHYRVSKARAKVETARAALREAEAAARTPRLAFDSEWEVRGPLDDAGADLTRGGVIGLSARRTFLTGRNGLPLELARLSLQAAERELAEETENVRLAALSAYVGLLKARLGVDASRLVLARAESALAEAEARAKAGMAGELDLLQIRAQRSRAQLEHSRAQARQRLAEARLNQELGRELSAPLTLVKQPFPEERLAMAGDGGGGSGKGSRSDAPSEAESGDPVQIGEAVDRRFDVFLAANQLERARLTAAYRVKENAWTATLSGSVAGDQGSSGLSWNSRDRNTALTVQGDLLKLGDELGTPAGGGSSGPQWSLNLTFSWPLYDGGVEAEKARQEEVNLRQLEEALEQSRRLAELEIADARLAWQEAEELIGITFMETEAARSRLRVSEQRVALGAETAGNLLDAQIAVVKAERAWQEARWDGLLALAGLRRATGGPVW